MRFRVWLVAAAVVVSAVSAPAQDRRGPEETERVSRKFRLAGNGRFSLANISGEVVVTGGSGDDVTIEAVKRTRGTRGELSSVVIEFDDRPGRVEVRTRHTARRDRAWVDYTVTVPRDAAVELSSISGDVRATDIRGPLRAQSVSGTVTASGSPNVELAKSISGNVEFVGNVTDGRLTGSTVSGTARARDVKARSLTLEAISGNTEATNVEAERLEMKTVSGDVVFTGATARNGRYAFNAHSGDIRLLLSGSAGFELNANTFSGSIRSDIPVTLGSSDPPGNRRRPGSGRATRAVVGDGSALLNVSTFSGDISIQRR
jgi:DUF4097 and DUF4098 domain-containing protein YvlB